MRGMACGCYRSLTISLTRLIRNIIREYTRRYPIPSRKYAWHHRRFRTIYWPAGVKKKVPVIDVVTCLVASRHHSGCYGEVLRVLYSIHNHHLRRQINLWLICFDGGITVYGPKELPSINSIVDECAENENSPLNTLVGFFRRYQFVRKPPLTKKHRFNFGLLIILYSDFDSATHSELVRRVVHLGPKIVWILCGVRGKFWEPIPYGHIYRVCCLGG